MRVWFLKQTSSIDSETSVGANTVVWSREGQIYRITPRRNDEVNDTWMPDSGRELFKSLKSPDRLSSTATVDTLVAQAAELFKTHAGAIAVVGSGRSSVEEQFLTKKLAATVKASAALVSRIGQADKLLISADKNPNVRGALVTGLIAALPSQKLTDLAALIDAGKVKVVVSVGEDLAAAGLSAAQLAKVSIVYLGTHANATSAAAKVVLPTLSVFEKNGTFVNQQFRLQKFTKAVPGPSGATDDLIVLAKLATAAGATVPSDLGSVWKLLSAETPNLAPITYANLPETGLLLDATPFATLPFVEGETLHYKPAVATLVPSAAATA
jgi:NADH-quinone oxidoreductase subunit G